jgi:hypothetical protein
MDDTNRDAIVEVWCAKDRARAVLPADRAIVDGSAAPRSLIVDLVLAGDPEDELYDACGVLGRLIAQRGGSPTLASSTLDHAAQSLGIPHAPWLEPARAAVAEGFVGALVEDVRRESAQAWEYPSCAVHLGDSSMAIAAGHPSDDEEVLAAWAGRLAKSAALKGVRKAAVSGNEHARAALADALGLVGIEVETRA